MRVVQQRQQVHESALIELLSLKSLNRALIELLSLKSLNRAFTELLSLKSLKRALRELLSLKCLKRALRELLSLKSTCGWSSSDSTYRNIVHTRTHVYIRVYT